MIQFRLFLEETPSPYASRVTHFVSETVARCAGKLGFGTETATHEATHVGRRDVTTTGLICTFDYLGNCYMQEPFKPSDDILKQLVTARREEVVRLQKSQADHIKIWKLEARRESRL
jgi:hypothetical protein